MESKLFEYQLHLMLSWDLVKFKQVNQLTNEEMKLLLVHLVDFMEKEGY